MVPARRSVARLVLVLGLLMCAAMPSALAASTHRGAAHHKRVCHRSRHHRCPKKRGKPAPGQGSSSRSADPTGSWTSPPGTVTPGAGGVEAPGTGTTGEAPGGSGVPPASGPAHVQVTAEDTGAFRFVLSRPSVPAGPVIIEFVNRGQDEHNLQTLEPSRSEAQGGLANTAPGAHPTLHVTLRHGSYTLFCSLPTHEERGMKATLRVE